MPTPIENLSADLGVPSQELPAVFRGPGLPLALGTDKALVERFGVPPERVHIALRRWVDRSDYLMALSDDLAQRFDLDGQPVEPVSHVHRQTAAIRLLNFTLHRLTSTTPEAKPAAVAAINAVKPKLALSKAR